MRDTFPENIGRVVRVVKRADWPAGFPEWTVETIGEPFLVMLVPGNMPAYEVEGDCYDADLRPISGVTIKDDQVVEVPA
ncbi:hypothetical protein D9M68_904750 [compost metagenome]